MMSYYPVNDEKNGALYTQYKELADKENNIIFGGRLGEYKYYDMDAVIASALSMAEKELSKQSLVKKYKRNTTSCTKTFLYTCVICLKYELSFYFSGIIIAIVT